MLILSAQIQPSLFVHRQILCAADVDDVVVDNVVVDYAVVDDVAVDNIAVDAGAVDAWNGRSCRLWH